MVDGLAKSQFLAQSRQERKDNPFILKGFLGDLGGFVRKKVFTTPSWFGIDRTTRAVCAFP